MAKAKGKNATWTNLINDISNHVSGKLIITNWKRGNGSTKRSDLINSPSPLCNYIIGEISKFFKNKEKPQTECIGRTLVLPSALISPHPWTLGRSGFLLKHFHKPLQILNALLDGTGFRGGTLHPRLMILHGRTDAVVVTPQAKSLALITTFETWSTEKINNKYNKQVQN